jgi:hypothetical protein
MSKHAVYAGSEMAKKVMDKFGDKTSSVSVDIRQSNDVSLFLKKMNRAHKKAGQSRIVFA